MSPNPFRSKLVSTARSTSKTEYGLHVLVDKHCDGLGLVDIVAIHGLNGHHERTWTAAAPATGVAVNWLKDLLPIEVTSARIMSFSYNSTVQFSKSTADISTYADQLLEHLLAARSKGSESSRPILFICHSLGGIVFKEVRHSSPTSTCLKLSSSSTDCWPKGSQSSKRTRAVPSHSAAACGWRCLLWDSPQGICPCILGDHAWPDRKGRRSGHQHQFTAYQRP